MSEMESVRVKLMLIGDTHVGKTCLLLDYTGEKFSPQHITTIGIDFKMKQVQVGERNVKLQIWDTAGQERFRTITTSYFRGAQGIALVYDVTSRKTFEGVAYWMEQIQQFGDCAVNKILVGNKCDLEGERDVSPEEGRELAKKYEVPFFETSAKSSVNVEKAFYLLTENTVKRLVAERVKGTTEDRNTDVDGQKKKSSCCS